MRTLHAHEDVGRASMSRIWVYVCGGGCCASTLNRESRTETERPEGPLPEVRNTSPNDGIFKVFPVGISELIGRNIFSMREIGSPCRLVFDISEGANGFDFDLNHTEFALLIG